MKYVISACLVGEKCKYDGGSNPHAKVKERFEGGDSIAVCPEVLGGLPVPRARTELERTGAEVIAGASRVINEDGIDVTDAFLSGSYQALEQAQKAGITCAILKARSPSCGCKTIYAGAFDGTTKEGSGVFAALLEKNDFVIRTEEDI